jgi:serralysin
MANFNAAPTGSNMLYFFPWAFLLPVDSITGSSTEVAVTNNAGLGVPFSLLYEGSGMTWTGTTPTGGSYVAISGYYNGANAGVLTTTSASFADIATANRYAVLDGNDFLLGSLGSDLLFGGFGGDDVFEGGGGGNDIFMVSTPLMSSTTNRAFTFGGSSAGFDKISVITSDNGLSFASFFESTFTSIEAFDFGLGVQSISLPGSKFGSGKIATNASFNQGFATDTVVLIRPQGVFSAANFTAGGNVTFHLLASNSSVPSNFTGSAYNDELTGGDIGDVLFAGAGDDLLEGQGGADSLSGDGGDDVLKGGAGNDTLSGGSNDADGGDTADFSDATGVVIAALDANGNSTVYAAGTDTDTLLAIENLLGGSFGDTLIGNAADNRLTGGGGDDVLIGGAGRDTLDGGAGNDTYYVDLATDVVFEGTSIGYDVIVSSAASFTMAANTELLVVTSNAASGTGTSGANTLQATGTGSTLNGLGGDDIYYFTAANTTVVEAAGGGFDTVILAGTGSFTLGANAEALALTAAGSTGTGNNAGNTLEAFAENCTLNGGTGNDYYVVAFASDVINEAANGGFDVMLSSASAMTQANNVEQLYVIAQNGVGVAKSSGGIVFASNTGVRLVSGVGNDTLYGGGLGTTFQFNASFGDDLIAGFTATSTGSPNHDVVDLSVLGLAGGFAALNFTNAAAGTTLHLGTESILFFGIQSSQLQASDFLF